MGKPRNKEKRPTKWSLEKLRGPLAGEKDTSHTPRKKNQYRAGRFKSECYWGGWTSGKDRKCWVKALLEDGKKRDVKPHH